MAIILGTGGADIRTLAAAGQTILGLAGNDTITGLGGTDSIYGGRGDDRLTGGDGNDDVMGGDGRDTINGGNGDDTLSGQFGFGSNPEGTSLFRDDGDRDVIVAGAGNDWVWLGRNDVANGGTGHDTLRVSIFEPGTSAAPMSLNFSGIGGAVAARVGHGTASAALFERVEVALANVQAGSTIIGTAGDDRMSVNLALGSSNGQPVYGATLNGGNGDDVLIGSGLKDDRIIGGRGDDLIDSGDGLDLLTGGPGADIFLQRITTSPQFGGTGGTEPDVITDFDPTRDMFLLRTTGGYGATVLAPTILVTGVNPVATQAGAQFLYDTSTGLLRYDSDGTGGIAGLGVALLQNRPALTARNIVVDDLLFVPELDVRSAPSIGEATQRAGTAGNDIFNGTAGPNHYWGALGNDSLRGLDGDDLLFGGRGNDRIDGGNGRDRLVGGDGADVVRGGAGNDHLGSGSGQIETREADDGDVDQLFGDAGDDILVAEARDRIDGGTGIDRLIMAIDGTGSPVTHFNFSAAAGAAFAAVGLGTLVRSVESVEVNVRFAQPGSTLTGTAGDDVLRLGISFNSPRLGGTVNGGAGDDTIFGSEHRDRLNGGPGDDILYVATNDTLVGGPGADTFVFLPSIQTTNALIRDFGAGDRFVVLYNGQFGDDLQLAPNILVSGVNPVPTGADQAQFLYDTATRQLFIDYNGTTAGRLYLVADFTGSSAPTAGSLAFEFLVA